MYAPNWPSATKQDTPLSTTHQQEAQQMLRERDMQAVGCQSLISTVQYH